MTFDNSIWLDHLRNRLKSNAFWSQKLSEHANEIFTLHLAILREPYLTFVMEGKKTIETRFAKKACPPFQRVNRGDVIMLKKTPGDIVGVCLVESAWFYHLDASSLKFIKSKFGDAICPTGPDFWEERKAASVASLILIGNVQPIKALKIKKRDRRGWVVFPSRSDHSMPEFL